MRYLWTPTDSASRACLSSHGQLSVEFAALELATANRGRGEPMNLNPNLFYDCPPDSVIITPED